MRRWRNSYQTPGFSTEVHESMRQISQPTYFISLFRWRAFFNFQRVCHRVLLWMKSVSSLGVRVTFICVMGSVWCGRWASGRFIDYMLSVGRVGMRDICTPSHWSSDCPTKLSGASFDLQEVNASLKLNLIIFGFLEFNWVLVLELLLCISSIINSRHMPLPTVNGEFPSSRAA